MRSHDDANLACVDGGGRGLEALLGVPIGLLLGKPLLDSVAFVDADAAGSVPGLARGSIRKIGSIGLKISRGVTSHGLSLNVSCDLEPFEWINSCGIETCQATSIARETGSGTPSMAEVATEVANRIASALGQDLRPGSPVQAGLERRGRANSVA